MKSILMALALAATAAAPVAAQELTVKSLADETGLTERQVRMVVGARTGFAEYRTIFNRVHREFKTALGQQRYDALLAGEPIQLHRKAEQGIASVEIEPRTVVVEPIALQER